LLKQGRAKVFRRYPFTIILKDLEVGNCTTHNHQLKIDPGAKTQTLATRRKMRPP
ncbi:MAG: HNH endonuclease, partial [Moorea sp. SIO2C4]|nr:HNH endonuclease [Moorena sp. SIO2C4]